jgi:hypothetical protein
VVTTAQPSAVSDTSATFHGTVNPEGQAATCFFEYGTSTSYGSRTNDVMVPAGSSAAQVTQTVNGLARNTPFHVRLVCGNSTGTANGQDVAFSTTNGGASVIRLSGHTGFVSPSGIGGVFIGCYGAKPCTGSLTLKRAGNGATVGHRNAYFIAPNAGGIIHVPLTAGAMRTLRSQGFLNVTVSSTTTDGQALQGGDAGRSLQLHIFR